MSSPAIFAITGDAGAVASICTIFVAGSLETPAVDLTVALTVVPVASAGTSPLAKLAVQRPALSAVTVLDVLPQLTVTLALGSAIPLTDTPAAFSAALTLSSLETTLITGVAGLTLAVVPVPVPAVVVVVAAALPPPPPPRTPPNTPPTNGVPTASQVLNPPPEDGCATGDVPTA